METLPFPIRRMLYKCDANMLAYNIPTSNSDYHLYSFSHTEWNVLIEEIVQLQTAESFKHPILSM